MIVRLPLLRTPGRTATGIAILDEVLGFWTTQRGAAVLPLADELYLTDLVGVFPHLLLAYRHGRGFRIEFTGEVARALLGGDLTGSCPTRADPDAARAALARNLGTAAALGVAGTSRCAGPQPFAAVHLPYADAEGGVMLVVTCLAPAPVTEGAKVLPFRVMQAGARHRPEDPVQA